MSASVGELSERKEGEVGGGVPVLPFSGMSLFVLFRVIGVSLYLIAL